MKNSFVFFFAMLVLGLSGHALADAETNRQLGELKTCTDRTVLKNSVTFKQMGSAQIIVPNNDYSQSRVFYLVADDNTYRVQGSVLEPANLEIKTLTGSVKANIRASKQLKSDIITVSVKVGEFAPNKGQLQTVMGQVYDSTAIMKSLSNAIGEKIDEIMVEERKNRELKDKTKAQRKSYKPSAVLSDLRKCFPSDPNLKAKVQLAIQELEQNATILIKGSDVVNPNALLPKDTVIIIRSPQPSPTPAPSSQPNTQKK